MGNNIAQNRTKGNNNVFIGALSAYGVSDSISGSVFLGNRSGYYETNSNRLHISNAITTTPLVYGEFDNNILALSPASSRLGIRTITPSQALHVKGQVQIDTLTTGAGSDSILVVSNGLVKKIASSQSGGAWDSAGLWQLNASNNLVPKTFSGAQLEINKPLNILGSTNAIQQLIKLPSSQTISTPIVQISDNLDSVIMEVRGYPATYSGTPAGSLFIGKNSGKNVVLGSTPVAGILNTALGGNSLAALTTGSSNTAIGNNALLNFTTGSFNGAFGMNSLAFLASGSDNLGVGQAALYGFTSGEQNVALGNNAAQNHTGGDHNVFIGTLSGYNVANSISGSVFIGDRSGYYESESNRLHIANAPTTKPLIYGQFDKAVLSVSPDSAKFGIRTMTPDQALHVKGQVKIDTLTTGSNTDSLLVVNNGVVKKIVPTQTAYVLDRANHTGVQDQSTITGLTDLLALMPRRVLYQTTRLSHTGNTTETEIYRDTIKHSIHPFGPNSSLHIPFLMSGTSSTNTRTLRLKLNGTTVVQLATSTTNGATWRSYFWMSNRNSLTSQITGGSQGAGTNMGFNASITGPPTTLSINTSGDVIVTVTAQVANSSENQGLDQMDVILYP